MAKIKGAVKRVMSRMGHGSHAEDCYQEVLLRMHKGKVSSTTNMCIDFVRSNMGDLRSPTGRLELADKAFPELIDERVLQEACNGETVAQKRAFKGLVAPLDPVSKAVVTLYYRWGMTGEEIGDLFGRTEQWVHLKVHEARRELRACAKSR